MDESIAQLPALVALLVGSSVFAFWFGLRHRIRGGALTNRLSQIEDRQKLPEALDMEQSFTARVLAPSLRQWARRLGHLMPQRNVERLQRSLDRAGRPYNLTASDFLGIRLLAGLAVAALVVVLLYVRNAPVIRIGMLGFAASAAGSLLPTFWLRRQGKARQTEIQRGLPDALDMLTVAVSAGLGLDGAMQTIDQKWDSPVAQEFGQAVREMQIGVPRMDALRTMARRADVQEMSNFVAVLVQADQLGLTISNVLKTQADQMRVMRRQRAEELANTAPIKMLFPLVFLIFPAIFAVILGPAIPRMVTLFETL